MIDGNTAALDAYLDRDDRRQRAADRFRSEAIDNVKYTLETERLPEVLERFLDHAGEYMGKDWGELVRVVGHRYEHEIGTAFLLALSDFIDAEMARDPEYLQMVEDEIDYLAGE